MAKTELEKAIVEATSAFALEIINAVQSSTLSDLIALQGGHVRKKPGPKPGSKRRKKPGPKPGAKKAATQPVKKKRVVKNYPKCAFPRCNNNRFVRGKGYCGDHWRKWKAGKIKAASTYKKK